MAKIIEGLTKSQVKQIIKLSKQKSLVGRTSLQGLAYEAETKTLNFTDGYILVSWDMHKIIEDFLPEENTLLHYKKLNEWVVNAGAKDVYKWGDMLKKSEPANVPALKHIAENFEVISGETLTARINPQLLVNLMPLLTTDDKVDIEFGKLADVVGMRITAKGDSEFMGMSALVMGIRK